MHTEKRADEEGRLRIVQDHHAVVCVFSVVKEILKFNPLYLIISGVLLGLFICPAAHAADWRFASPQKRLFRPLLADPTETRFGIIPYLSKNRLEGDIGGSWEAFDVSWDDARPLRLRVGIHSGVFTLLRKDGVTYPLDTADFLIGIHADMQKGLFTGRFEFVHVSAHLADGFKGTRTPITYSREYFTLYGAYQLPHLRLYGSLRASNHAIPDTRRWRLQAGGELVSGRLFGHIPRSYLAWDMRIFSDGGTVANHTVQAGLMIHNTDQAGLRIAMIIHTGRSEHGQFHDLNDQYAGLGLFFDL